MSSRLWLTVFSSSSAASMASIGLPQSIVVGLAMSWKTTRPPLLVWYSINFMPWARSSFGEIDVGGIEFHVDLLVDQRLAVLVVVLPNLGHGHLDRLVGL